jgi:hypothetical protein
VFAAGLLFSLVRRRVGPLPIRWYVLLCVPMAIDGTTQLFGWRESTWELRVITGFLFGLASAWLVFPILERGMREVRDSLERPAGVLPGSKSPSAIGEITNDGLEG